MYELTCDVLAIADLSAAKHKFSCHFVKASLLTFTKSTFHSWGGDKGLQCSRTTQLITDLFCNLSFMVVVNSELW